MRSHRRSLVLLAGAALVAAVGSSGSLQGQSRKAAGDRVFGTTKVESFHLQMDAKEFAGLQPAPTKMGPGGGFGFPGGQQRPPVEGSHRNTFGVDLPWRKGDLTYAGVTYKDVGVRYKGNYTFMASSKSLKKSLKIDLDRHGGTEKLDGLKTFNFNCGISDPSRVREAFSYAFFRAAGVPAPRTSFAELSLTVPGKYERELVGLFTLVEQVNKPFLERHFKNGKGMLLKPEGLQGGLQHLGEDWQAYEQRYRPKSTPTDAEKQRLIAFTRLIQRGSKEEFEKEIRNYLDVEAFLRYLAANALLANLDSYLGFGHNFYLYLVPKTKQFVFIPWDLDLSMATWPAAGSPEQQVDLSLMHPHSGENKLIDRLLAIPEVSDRYRKILGELASGPFAKEKLLEQLEALEKAVRDARSVEAKAVAARREGGGGGFGPFGGGAFGQSMPPRRFIELRTASVEAQLAGKKKGYVPRAFGAGPPGGFGPPPGGGMGGFGPPPRPGEILSGTAQDRLRLNPEQRQQLRELQKEVDARLEKLLTPQQREEWKKMREAQPAFPGGGFPFPGRR